MCGICGIYSKNNNVNINKLEKINSLLYHRGPDSKGHFLSQNKNIGLAMRRLSIQDVENGIQPVFNEKKDIVAVFNGEIYNFKSLRKELLKKGHILNSNSDSEIIPHLFEEYGTEFVNYCNGMFVIAIYYNNELFIFRDRIGIKPLFFAETNNEFLFSSELKSIVNVFPELKQLDIKNLNSYLKFSYIPEPNSIYKNVKKLLPGHFIVYGKNRFDIIKYWFPENFIGKENKISEAELEKKFEELLYDSIKLRMISDVPLGAFLSGGLDSSSIVSFMNRVSSNIKTFSIGFSGNDLYNETNYAQKIANCFNTDHYEKTIDLYYRKIIDEITPFIDEPFSDSSCIPMYLLSKMTKEHVTVSLSGTGSDEILGGYRRYSLDKICKPFSIIPGFADILFKLTKNINVSRETKFQQYMLYLKKILNIARNNDQKKYFEIQSVFSNNIINELLLNENNIIDRFNVFKRYLTEFRGNSFLQMAQFLDLKIYLPSDLLVKEDKMTMATSLESRVPFLDHRLVEFCLSLPDNMKLNRFNGKYILKKIMNLEIPENIIKRPKHGFAVPIEKWFRQILSDELLDLCFSKNSISRKYFNLNQLENLVKIHKTKKQDYSSQLWNIFMLELWNKEHNLK